MDHPFFSLLTLVLQWFRPRYNVHLQLLQAQIRILRSRIDVSRTVPTPQEKAELLRLGAMADHDIGDVMHIVQPETYRKWVRHSKRGVVFKRPGRARIPMATVNLVLRMAEENVRWGYRRIVGEFKKLGIRIGSSTVKKILKGSDIHPAPDKGFKKPAIPWTTFVHAHMDSMVGTDLGEMIPVFSMLRRSQERYSMNGALAIGPVARKGLTKGPFRPWQRQTASPKLRPFPRLQSSQAMPPKPWQRIGPAVIPYLATQVAFMNGRGGCVECSSS